MSNKGNKVLPFNVFSSSKDTGYNKKVSDDFGNTIDFFGHHNDSYLGGETPMQTPFTEEHVGGNQNRHQDTNEGSDDESNRAEAWRTILTTDQITLRPATYGSDGNLNLDLPRAERTRDLLIKRPVNIKNIKYTSASSKLGNYNDEYQITQAGDAYTNKPNFVKAEGFDIDASISTFIEDLNDYTKPTRERRSHVVIERFSAPGGPEQSGDAQGGAGLDVIATQYSPYNTLNHRNTLVRSYLNLWYKDHVEGYGLKTAPSATSYDVDVSASYHKVPKNETRQIAYTSSNGVYTASFYDNWFVQHDVPALDRNYAWITSSIYEPDTDPLSKFRPVTSSTQIVLISASAPFYRNAAPQTKSLVAFNHGPLIISEVSSSNQGPLLVDQDSSYTTFLTDTLNPHWSTLGNQFSYAEYNKEYLGYFDKGFGFPSWKQIRNQDHACIRKQRKDKQIIFTTDEKQRQIHIIGRGLFTINEGGENRVFDEPMVSTKFKPFIHVLEPKVVENNTYPLLEYDYTNNRAFFANAELNSLTNINDENEGIYESIISLYLGSQPSSGATPIKDLASLIYRERVWPRSVNEGRSIIRERNSFTVPYWRTLRSARTVLTSSNTQNETISASSIWPLDARENFDTGVSYTSYTYNNNSIPTNSCGELQNPYINFHNDNSITQDAAGQPLAKPGNLKVGMLFNRRVPVSVEANFKTSKYIKGDPLFYDPLTTNDVVIFAGDTKWQTGDQRGKEPFNYDTYAKWAVNIRNKGKDYSLIPEFRMADHIEKYISGSAEFLQELSASLDITGSNFEATGSLFYRIFSHSDFLSNFGDVKEDHDGYSTKRISFTCRALKKFLPYDGFYPVQRCMQMGRLFYDAYRDGFVASSSTTDFSNKWRLFAEPFIAPGLLFNSIKSGIAVSYPYWSSFQANSEVSRDAYVREALDFKMDENYINVIDSRDPLNGTDYDLRSPTVIYPPYAAFSNSVGSSGLTALETFKVLPFETLLNPEGRLLGEYISDCNPHKSSSFDSYGAPFFDLLGDVLSNFDENKSKAYKLSMHNFLAETMNFFLPKGRATNVSLPDNDPRFGNVDPTKDVYQMDVALYNTINPLGQVYNFSGSSETPPIANIYSNQASFGFPLDFTYTLDTAMEVNDQNVHVTASAFSAFTPPYADGVGYARISFTPYKSNDTKYTLDEVFSGLSVEYFRPLMPGEPEDPINGTWSEEWEPGDKTEYARTTNYRHRMHVSSSINLLSRGKLRKVTYEALTGKPLEVTSGTSDELNVWVIEPKWESPAFDHSRPSSSISFPESGSGAISRGVWHQYPSDINSTKGIYMQVLPPITASSGTETRGIDFSNSTTGSLAELVGFSPEARRVGAVAEEKTIREAIVAIPFVTGPSGDPEFISIAREKIEIVQGTRPPQDLNFDPQPSLIQMVEKMQKYYLPPRLDFITNENIEPFAMYIFEFEHKFDKQDLVDIWYNLPPKLHNDFKYEEVNIGHDIGAGEILEEELSDDIRWMVFKVKQKGEKNYFRTLADTKGDARFGFEVDPQSNSKDSTVEYSYNWPYDYCSFVELANVEMAVEIGPEDE